MAKRHNRHTGGPCQAWRADGTPYEDEDYRRAGLPVPTPEQLALWAAQEEEDARDGSEESSIRTRIETA